MCKSGEQVAVFQHEKEETNMFTIVNDIFMGILTSYYR